MVFELYWVRNSLWERLTAGLPDASFLFNRERKTYFEA